MQIVPCIVQAKRARTSDADGAGTSASDGTGNDKKGYGISVPHGILEKLATFGKGVFVPKSTLEHSDRNTLGRMANTRSDSFQGGPYIELRGDSVAILEAGLNPPTRFKMISGP
jgi:hypothetical protein